MKTCNHSMITCQTCNGHAEVEPGIRCQHCCSGLQDCPGCDDCQPMRNTLSRLQYQARRSGGYHKQAHCAILLPLLPGTIFLLAAHSGFVASDLSGQYDTLVNVTVATGIATPVNVLSLRASLAASASATVAWRRCCNLWSIEPKNEKEEV